MNNNTFDKDWSEFKRKILRFGSFIGWVVGAIFSYIGFTSGTHDGLFWKIIGICLTLMVTVLELWMNGTKLEDLVNGKSTFGDLLLFLGGGLSYIYDAWTNFLGLCVLMLGVSHVVISQLSWSDMITPAIAGILLAALPEPMFVASRVRYIKPTQPVQPSSQYVAPYKPNNQHQPKPSYDPKTVPAISPKWQSKHKKTDPRKVVSNLFLDNYTKKYKK